MTTWSSLLTAGLVDELQLMVDAGVLLDPLISSLGRPGWDERTSDESRDAASSTHAHHRTVGGLMIVVAGHLHVDPDSRASYLEGCQDVVRLARASQGCLDFALSPDLVDPGRINVFERWKAAADVEASRRSGCCLDGTGDGDDPECGVWVADTRHVVPPRDCCGRSGPAGHA